MRGASRLMTSSARAGASLCQSPMTPKRTAGRERTDSRGNVEQVARPGVINRRLHPDIHLPRRAHRQLSHLLKRRPPPLAIRAQIHPGQQVREARIGRRADDARVVRVQGPDREGGVDERLSAEREAFDVPITRCQGREQTRDGDEALVKVWTLAKGCRTTSGGKSPAPLCVFHPQE